MSLTNVFAIVVLETVSITVLFTTMFIFAETVSGTRTKTEMIAFIAETVSGTRTELIAFIAAWLRRL